MALVESVVVFALWTAQSVNLWGAPHGESMHETHTIIACYMTLCTHTLEFCMTRGRTSSLQHAPVGAHALASWLVMTTSVSSKISTGSTGAVAAVEVAIRALRVRMVAGDKVAVGATAESCAPAARVIFCCCSMSTSRAVAEFATITAKEGTTGRYTRSMVVTRKGA